MLRSLREQLDGQPVSVILTDPTGLVLSRLTADADLERHLDKVLLAPGFSYAERFVGTNGIGTALEVGGPAHVFGHEHYAEHLEDLACAGVPIHHPVTGRTVGAVDLTCWRRDAGSLLLTLAKTTAERIRQALLAETGMHQLELFTEYLRTCQRVSGIVLAVSGGHGDDERPCPLDARPGRPGRAARPGDRGAGLRPARIDGHGAAERGRRPDSTGAMVSGGGKAAGVVVHVKLGESVEQARRRPAGGHAAAVARTGRIRTAVAARVCRGRAGLPVGPVAGGGRRARRGQARRAASGPAASPAGRAVHRPRRGRRRHGSRWGTELRRSLAHERRQRRHPARRPARRSTAAAAVRRTSRGRHGRAGAAAVGCPDAAQRIRTTATSPACCGCFPSTVEVPPLRMHLEDLQELVSFFLARLGRGRQLTCSPEAMQLLQRSSWPGNAEQLNKMLRQVVQHRRTGTIVPEDLPPEARTVSRRLLSPLEAIERDAIVQSLVDATGNKAQGGTLARRLPGHDLPQDPRVRNRVHLAADPGLTRPDPGRPARVAAAVMSRNPGPRSSGDRASASGAVCAGSNPAGGTPGAISGSSWCDQRLVVVRSAARGGAISCP